MLLAGIILFLLGLIIHFVIRPILIFKVVLPRVGSMQDTNYEFIEKASARVGLSFCLVGIGMFVFSFL